MRSLLRLALPLTLWLACFSAVYGLAGLLCSSRWSPVADDTTRLTLLALAAMAAVVLQAGLVLALRSPRWQDPDTTLRRASLVLAVAALVSTIWTLLPPLLTTHSCDTGEQAHLPEIR
ncbi:hypothetical protein GCM10011534_38690 [Pseudooceanicola nanhaiensis]|jgi:hypothetical protein|uniref:Uncharacterized protein n=1 Tax=Pseudooceanicola nanhaiensis TaxID=375761 RepID=A0A917WLF2_9RHOB|nr:hypothetical protein [Pseudooceanicola nanhaiensis]GGM12895.1 hypothetical protein GCM10011534_38690 [Pseudooceanicola nanhaiensis]